MAFVREVLTLVSIVVALLAYLQFSSDSHVFRIPEQHQTAPPVTEPKKTMRLPTYFFSHGGVSVSPSHMTCLY